MTYTQLLQDHLDYERTHHGLVDFKFTVFPQTFNRALQMLGIAPLFSERALTVEEIAEGLCDLLTAPNVPDPNLL